MPLEFTRTTRSLGISSAAAVAVLLAVYAVCLGIGLASLESPDDQIADPFFSILEVLIIVMAPAMVALMVGVHGWAPAHLKALSLAALVFMGMLAGVTGSLHFVILTASRQPAFEELAASPLFFSFTWPSIAYSLDIAAWDVFFPLSMFFAAGVFTGSRLATSIRILMVLSGLLALAGLIGVAAGDMNLRNIGIVGYVGVFLIVAAALAVLFYRARPVDSMTARRDG